MAKLARIFYAMLALLTITACDQAPFETKKAEFLKATQVFTCSNKLGSSYSAAHGSIDQPADGQAGVQQTPCTGDASGALDTTDLGHAGGALSNTGLNGAGSNSMPTAGNSSVDFPTSATAGNSTIGFPTSTTADLPQIGWPSASATPTLRHVTLPSPLPAPKLTEIPFLFMCSMNQMSRSDGVALSSADRVDITLTDRVDGSTCVHSDPKILTDLMTNKTIDFAPVFADCAAQNPSFNANHLHNYSLTGHRGSSSATLDATEYISDMKTIVAKIDSHFEVSVDTGIPTPTFVPGIVPRMGFFGDPVVSGTNRPDSSGNYTTLPTVFFDGRASFRVNGAYTDGQACDWEISPLIIRLTDAASDTGMIDLTSPFLGQFFDILGRNSFPYPHAEKQISWFANRASRMSNYILTLPDARGEVGGIDQLFGNNTFGPDNRFAANGYEALRKWDGRRDDDSIDTQARDGVINKNDPVFARLRLWRDANGDAIAHPRELFSLEELGVAEIDLNYDPSFAERDQYGNETRMKSTVKMKDASLRLIYDLWYSKAAID